MLPAAEKKNTERKKRAADSVETLPFGSPVHLLIE